MKKLINKVGQLVCSAYQKVERAVVGGYQKMERAVVDGFGRMTDGCVALLFARQGESPAAAKARLAAQATDRT